MCVCVCADAYVLTVNKVAILETLELSTGGMGVGCIVREYFILTHTHVCKCVRLCTGDLMSTPAPTSAIPITRM